jgi:group I intron endonuclease
MLIYKAEHLQTGMVYVGQTQTKLSIRINRHHTYGDSYFCRAIKKYGRAAFQFTILEEVSCKEDLDDRERFWIMHYDCMVPKGFNLTSGGGGTSGWKASDEIRAKVSAALTGKPKKWTEEGLQRLRDSHRGVSNLTEEGRRRISEANKGKVIPKEQCRARSERMMGHQINVGRKHTEETKKKMSAVQTGRIVTP